MKVKRISYEQFNKLTGKSKGFRTKKFIKPEKAKPTFQRKNSEVRIIQEEKPVKRRKTVRGRCIYCGKENALYSKHIFRYKKSQEVHSFNYKIRCFNCKTYRYVQRSKEVYEIVKPLKWIQRKPKINYN